MIFLLSPAKNMRSDDTRPDLPRSKTRLQTDVRALMKVTQSLTRQDLQRLMKISDKLAELNFQRFQSLVPAGRQAASGQRAALAFNGDVYRGLDVDSFSSADWEFAQAHLRILSGLYGLLRPLDSIHPYRLEMGTRLATDRGTTLYAFWGDKIAKLIRRDLKEHDHRYVINLASGEYFTAVDKSALGIPVITPSFREEKDGASRVIGLFTKKARGMMARWAIQARIQHPNALQAFTLGGYRFVAAQSSSHEWVFTRPQPAKKAA